MALDKTKMKPQASQALVAERVIAAAARREIVGAVALGMGALTKQIRVRLGG
jgi:hypothetical protein